LLFKDVFDVISEVKLDLTGMNSGVYVLKVNGVSKRIIKK